jgi:hypothetical protein
MAGPTTEILVEGSLIDTIHKVEISLNETIHKVNLDLREVSTQIKGLLSAIKILAVLVLTSISASIWWGATLTANSRSSEVQMEKFEERLEKIESNLTRILEQTRPMAK